MAGEVSRNPELIRGIGKVADIPQEGAVGDESKEWWCFPFPRPQAKSLSLPLKSHLNSTRWMTSKKARVNKHKPRPTKLRASIDPGTVLIILAGRFKGKRVVFLKQLSSGLLLITGSFKLIPFKELTIEEDLSGPFEINGAPLRRVNQSYVIATSTNVDISGVNVEKFDDKYFAKQVEKKKKKSEGEFFEAEKEEKNLLPEVKKEDQKSVDAPLIKSIESVQDLKTYLGATFSLKAGMNPHELVFQIIIIIIVIITFLLIGSRKTSCLD